jgi:hypothetical protein
LTPSPVIATISPDARSASQIRSLDSGELRAKTTSSSRASKREVEVAQNLAVLTPQQWDELAATRAAITERAATRSA